VFEKELTEAVDLCLANGRLNSAAIGWSRLPLHTCNLNGQWPRKKRWNYWAITTPTHLFSVTVSNLDYAGLVFVYFADFSAQKLQEATKIVPFGRGIRLPDTVAGAVHFASGDMRVDMTPTPSGISLGVGIADFHSKPLVAQFTITIPSDHESLNVVVPWDEKTFQFTSKQNTLPANGKVVLGAETIYFKGAQSFACLDYGRGVWPRNCVWNWGSASGVQNGRVVGLNLGGRWTDGTGCTENALCIDGRLSKISEDLLWHYDRANYQLPWRITAPSGAVDLTFTPFLERVAASDLGLVKSEVHQMFGRYEGTLSTAGGETLHIADMIGWAEDHAALW
jgi:hypothetical protein